MNDQLERDLEEMVCEAYQTGVREFTVDLVSLMRETGFLLIELDRGGAGIGLINGFQVALGHLHKLALAAEKSGDPDILLRLFALGLVTSPVGFCKELGTWNESHEPLARRLGALKEVDVTAPPTGA